MLESTYIKDNESIYYTSRGCWLQATETNSGWLSRKKKHALVSCEIVPGLSNMIGTRQEKETRRGKLCRRWTPVKAHHLTHLVGKPPPLTPHWKMEATDCLATTDAGLWTLLLLLPPPWRLWILHCLCLFMSPAPNSESLAEASV